MRARLLDLGEVGAVRSQSVYHAVTAAMRQGDDPALILLRPASPGVTVGSFQGTAVDFDFCNDRRLPVIWRHDGGGAGVLDDNQLCFQLAAPHAVAVELGLPADLVGRFERLSRAPIEALRRLGIDAAFRPVNRIFTRDRHLGAVGIAEIGGGVCFLGSLVFDFDPEVLAGVLQRDALAIEASTTSIRRELSDPPGLAEIAEALVAACESSYGLELYPSLPTPDEMESIYEWDERLVTVETSYPARLTA